jgi:hypothetical protein
MKGRTVGWVDRRETHQAARTRQYDGLRRSVGWADLAAAGKPIARTGGGAGEMMGFAMLSPSYVLCATPSPAQIARCWSAHHRTAAAGFGRHAGSLPDMGVAG